MPDNDIKIVLAHGAWADGSSWNKVILLLRAQGVPAIAAPLPLTSLADDIEALDRSLERIEGQVILVGHAYAGAVIGGTQSNKVEGLVYVAALAPDEGETVADVFYRAEPHPRAPKLAPNAHGMIWLPEEAFSQAFAPHASPEEQAVLAAIQRPISVSCIGVKVGRPLWKDRPSWYFLAEEDHMIPSETQRFMAERMQARVQSQPVDHTPSVTAPNAVAGIILDAMREIAGQ